MSGYWIAAIVVVGIVVIWTASAILPDVFRYIRISRM
jgi:hypothetical protein